MSQIDRFIPRVEEASYDESFSGRDHTRVRRIAVTALGLPDDGAYGPRSECGAIHALAADQQDRPVKQLCPLDLLADVFREHEGVGSCRVFMCREQAEEGKDMLSRNAGPHVRTLPAVRAPVRPVLPGILNMSDAVGREPAKEVFHGEPVLLQYALVRGKDGRLGDVPGE